MKTLLNCDDVFDVLTAGPFPSGEQSDQQVQQHLETCVDCRSLAESLRPACGLLHEALSAGERTGLPVYLADNNQISEIMHRVRSEPIAQTHASGPSVKQVLVWNSLAATVVLLLLFPWLLGGQESTHVIAHGGNAREALLGMTLPADCLQVAMAGRHKILHPAMSAGDDCESCHEVGSVEIHGNPVHALDYFCCTECHFVSSAKRPQVNDVARLIAACQTCHSEVDSGGK